MNWASVNWTHGSPAVLAAFLASLVEFVEALTIVLAVGVTRGWISALSGAAAGGTILAALVILLGPNLQRLPLNALQIAVGILLLLFGTRWLRKAILRAAGVLGLHDEEKIFVSQVKSLSASSRTGLGVIDGVAFITSLKAVFVEGLEVVFIVVAVGAAGGMLLPATAGAVAAGALVIGLGIILHKPLAKVPENTLKFSVGILLSAFGVFWTGEGLGYQWIGQDWAIPGLIAGFLAVALSGVRLARRRSVMAAAAQ